MLSLCLTASLSRSAESDPHRFDIRAQNLASALNDFAQQSRQQILFAPDLVAQKLSSPVRGDMQSLAALKLLLKDSGLSFTTTVDGTFLVRAGKPSASSPRPVATAKSSEEPDSITVEGVRDEEKRVRRRARSYVSAIAEASQGKYLARWTKDAPLCPLLTGLAHDDATLLQERLLKIAASIGVPTADEYCTPNLHILVTPQPDEALKEWIRHYPWMFDSQIDDGGSKIRAFLSASSPARSWYNVAFKGFASFDYLPATPAAFLAGTTRPGVGIHRDLWSVIVVVDARAAQSVSLDQLAAYIAMVGLAQIRVNAKINDIPTILQLFSDAKSAPPGLSPWDRAYLNALYNAQGSEAIEIFELTEAMTREVAR
jgi:hypothetical protein